MKKKDNSYIYQRDKLNIKLNIKQDIPWTPKQLAFIELALNKTTKCIFIKGSAGTTKTFISMYCALTLLNEHRVSDIVLVRSVTESSDNKLGFLPGSIDDKFSVYVTPFYDKLNELLPDNQIVSLQKDKRLISCPVNYTRGHHWAVKAVVIDEAQNLCKEEFLTLLTRIGEYSKVFILGDPDQSDLVNGKRQDFTKVYNAFDNEDARVNGIYTFAFEEADILRSEFVRYIVKTFKNIK